MRKILALLLMLLPCEVLLAQTPATSPSHPLVFTHVTMIDVTGGPPKPKTTVVVTGNRIAAVGKTGKVRIPKNAQVIDATGKFLIPGLWDMPAHALTDNRYEWVFPLLVANGVTGIRELGNNSPFERINQIRREILVGKISGPRFGATTGRILDGPGTKLDEAWEVTTAEQARNFVKEYKRQGMDFIKPYDRLSREVYLAIADEARRQKIRVAGHVPFSMSAAEVSDLGQISIEHNVGIALACSRDEDSLRKELQELSKTSIGVFARQPIDRKAMMSYDEEKARFLFARFARNGTWMCPTMILSPVINAQKPETASRLKYIPVPMQEVWHNVLNKQDNDAEARRIGRQKKFEIVGLMHRTGVGLLAGSDICNPYTFPGFSLHDELALFVEAGLTPLEALQTATINPAKFLDKEQELGTVEEGELADLVLLNANPLADIGNTRKIAAVVLNGRYLPRERLQRMLADVEAVVSKL